jgi:hypothetical protein
MELIGIAPSNQLSFLAPKQFARQFTIANLGVRSLCIHIIPLHQHLVSVSSTHATIEPFGAIELRCTLHWRQELNCLFKSKLRVYICELDDDETAESASARMFGHHTNANNLCF